MISYNEAVDFLFNQRPAFERQGNAGYKPGLETSLMLDEYFHQPHKAYKTIHIAGTNGKGSVSHILAAILQSQGYTVGLYTSPHFIDFRERIKVNGEMISEAEVIDYVTQIQNQPFKYKPSFFELTTALAFSYFKKKSVDYAIIETGLGGRLDSTNIITPELCVITNISLDHTEFLGDSIEQISSEKAGIIKKSIPVVIGEATECVRDVMIEKAMEVNAPITFAQDCHEAISMQNNGTEITIQTQHFGHLTCQLAGSYQEHNIKTVLAALLIMRQRGIIIDNESVATGFSNICNITGFRGRWMILSHSPITICDSAHNIAGIEHVTKQLNSMTYNQLHIIIGFMADKDIEHILQLLPQKAIYYFTQASTPRALNAQLLKQLASARGLHGDCYDNVNQAHNIALTHASNNDLIYIGGSMYVLSELFSNIYKK